MIRAQGIWYSPAGNSLERMPGMTGVELLKRARQLLPGAKRILLTGYADMGAIVNAINEAAIYHYIAKPYDQQDLLLKNKRAWSPACSTQALYNTMLIAGSVPSDGRSTGWVASIHHPIV